MMKMPELSKELVEEILSKTPITSLGTVRAIRKEWNASSKERLLCQGEPKHEFPGFMVMDHRLCSIRFNFHGILNEDGADFTNPSTKEISRFLNQVDVSKVFHCDGLVLCATRDNANLVVWNPYLGKTMWIEPKIAYKKTDKYAMGYDKSKNYKILRFYDEYEYYKVYDFKKNSWGEYDVLPGWDIDCYQRSVALNGDIYFLTREKEVKKDKDRIDYLCCFDSTTENFGEFLPMPFQYHVDYIATLSRAKEEKLAALYQRWDTREMEIWVTTKIEPNEVLWSNLFKVDMTPLISFGFQCEDEAGSFFIHEEKKLAVVFNLDEKSDEMTEKKRCYHTAYIVGENRYLKKVVLGESVEKYCYPLVCSSSYVPRLVEINENAGPKPKEKTRKRKVMR